MKNEYSHHALPALFVDRLKKILPTPFLSDVLLTFTHCGPISIRINSLKINRLNVLNILNNYGLEYSEVSCVNEALILTHESFNNIQVVDLVKKGLIYKQGISSFIPIIVLNPQEGENILDMCAAPGGKTTHMAALMNNKGSICAVENIKNRFYKLKSVTDLLGAKNVKPRLTDARRLKFQGLLYDKILIDAPCSSEGRFKTFDKKTFAYWSLRKIKEMARKQKGLLLTASRLLKKGGVLVYSTCTFAPEENEASIDWLLRKTDHRFIIEEIHIKGIETYAALSCWGPRTFSPQIQNCMRILPKENMSGFFIVKMRKL